MADEMASLPRSLAQMAVGWGIRMCAELEIGNTRHYASRKSALTLEYMQEQGQEVLML